MLYLNELPLKHVYEFLDGMTSGPNSFKGPIGKAINELLPIANFQAINGYVNRLHKIVISELSTDQHFLYHISMAVKHGREYIIHHKYNCEGTNLHESRI